jgi:UDP-glucose 4-epimerase
MLKILLTGGTGFIGSHTAVALAQAGFHPLVVDNFSNSERWIQERIEALAGSPVSFYEADCRDFNALTYAVRNAGGVDGIIHLAAFKSVGESIANPLKYFENNLGSMIAVLKLMESEHIGRLVFSSSCTVYGDASGPVVHESTPVGPAQSPYGFTKQGCERMLKQLAPVHPNWRMVSLRYFNPMGAHPSGLLGELPLGVPSNLVPYITQTAAGVRNELTIFGSDYPTPDGTCIRDYIHVCDLADAHVKALQYTCEDRAPVLDFFNLGTGRGTSVLELIKTFERETGVKLPYKIGPRRPGDVAQVYANVNKAAHTLGWKVKYNMADGLKHAWIWEKSLRNIS